MRQLSDNIIMLRLMMKLSILAILVILSGVAIAEPVHPSGYNVTSQYTVNSTNITVGDTLVITRTITNNSGYTLSGAYLIDNMPSQFSVVSQAARLNGSNITYQYTNNINPPLVSGYVTSEWLIDDPDGSPANNINSGGSLVITVRAVCAAAGQYQLPFHTVSFYGNNTGFYATDNALTININNPVDTTPPAAILDLGAE